MSILGRLLSVATSPNEQRMNVSGWDRYARWWRPDNRQVVSGGEVRFLGDEWTVEHPGTSGSSYGLSPEVTARFGEYLSAELLDRYLPKEADQGLEIGPGGGRVTALLAPRTRVLHLADSAAGMLSRLKQRFADRTNLRYYRTDGLTLPSLPASSLDYVIAFDVFVHFEPRLVFWYLRQMAPLLKPGGTGIVHYANVLTPLGWPQFERHLQKNVKGRTFFAAFGTMCPELMGRFLQALDLEIVTTDSGAIPRDAIAVFRKRA